MPHPNDFREYEATLPGAAHRIVSMAETSNAARNENMTKAVDAEIKFADTGQTFAILIALTGLIAAIVFFAKGNDVAGISLVSFPLVLLVRSFLPSKSNDS